MRITADVMDDIRRDSATDRIPLTEPERQYYYIEKGRELIQIRSHELGRVLKFCVTTFGCQMNARDSEKLRGILSELGFSEAAEDEADFVIFNTCTVRENANSRLYGRLGQLKPAKKNREFMMIALCGCMMQEPDVIEKLKKSYSFVDIVFGTHNIHKLAEMLVASLESGKMIVDVWKDTDLIVENLPNQRKYPFKSGVNIIFGCNNFCSYCIVPYVRGRERSRNIAEIINEINRLASDGVTEVMLLGQNVNSYGKTLKPPIRFSELLQEVEKVPGIRRIRFMTSHPKDLSDDIIEVMKNSKKICRHIHLPLQSGSTRILKVMRRQYTKEQYLALVDKLRLAMPDISITTDIIVGFPGETEEDFNETLDVVEKVRYDSAFTFIYSKRTGTKAAEMEDQIPESVIKERFDRLLSAVQENAAKVCAIHEGTVQEVLVESLCEQDDMMVTGRLGNNLLVHFPGKEEMIGQYVDVELTECKGFYYLGNISQH